MFGRRKSADVRGDAPEVVVGDRETAGGGTEVIASDQVTTGSRRRKRLRRVLVLVLVLGIACGAALFAFANRELTRATVAATRPLEYARAFDEDLTQVIASSSDLVGVEVQGDIDITAVGTQSLPVRLTLGPLSRTDTVEIEVVDTRSPEISLKATSVTIELGDELETSSVVAEVTDPVDGKLVEVEDEPKAREDKAWGAGVHDEGFYYLEGTDDLMEAGDHDVRVIAVDAHGNKSVEHVHVTVTDPLEGAELEQTTKVLEYAKKKVDPSTLVSCNVDGVDISATDIDLSKVGKTKVTYTLKKGASTHTDQLEFEVRDTQSPEISLKAKSVTIELGDDLKASSIVKKVADPVDGELSEVAEEPASHKGQAGCADVYDKGFYLIEGTDDLAKAGDHEVRVVAADAHGNRSEKRVSVTVADPLAGVELKKKTDVVEYAKKKVDPVTLVSCNVEGVKITATEIDLSKMGKTKVTYTLKKGASTRKKEFEFEVRDTKKPIIELTADSKEIKEGQSFEPSSLVKSVRDEVDGELARKGSQKEGEGFYAVEGKVDTANPGKYFLKVVAQDKNGNKAEKEVSVTVTATEVPRQTSAGSSGWSTGTTTTTTPASSAGDYVLNTNTYKFHYPSCRYVGTIYDENREDVRMTREEIISRGYDPCKHCNP